MNRREKLINYAIKYNGDYYRVYRALKYEEDVKEYNKQKAITILDDEYPKCFYDLSLPPLVLFYQGDISLLNRRCVGVIGSRSASHYAKEATIHLVSELKKKYVIVSGLAKGIDELAHKSSLDYQTIGIIGSGLDYIYPKQNEYLYKEMSKNHLIISEYPLSVLPHAKHFPFRNRLISALSEKLFVMQASLKSGTLITVNEALNINREIYALPYSIYQKEGIGTNFLIEEGSRIISLEDFKDY